MSYRRIAFAAVLAVAANAPLAAQNLVVNRHFDLDLDGWVPNGAVGTFDGTSDANGNPASGSVRGAIDFVGPGSTAAVSQNVPVVGGAAYAYGGTIFIPTTANVVGFGTLSAIWYSDASCTTLAEPFNYSAPGITTRGAWLATSVTHSAPATAVCARLSLDFTGSQAGPAVVQFDDVFFRPAAGPPPDELSLLVNHHFDLDLAGWSTNGGVGSFDAAHDAGGNPASGSIRGTFDFAGVGANHAGSQRQPVIGSTTYDLGGEIFIPVGPQVTESAIIAVIWYSDATCTNVAFPPIAETPAIATRGLWLPTSTSATAPANASCARLFLIFSSLGAGSGEVLYDDVYLRPRALAADVSIPTLDFRALTILAVLLAGCGAWMLRRRTG